MSDLRVIIHANFAPIAKALGWEYSPAHGGWISENHRRQGIGGDTYIVEVYPADACFADGIETLEQMYTAAGENSQ